MNLSVILRRTSSLFCEDLDLNRQMIKNIIDSSKVLVIGGAGSIGQSVSKLIFSLNPKTLHVVDISENNLTELVRDLRSTIGYIDGDFRTFALDCGSLEFELLISREGPYDYVFNLSALKHVRSEKDPYTLMRMIDVNICNTIKTFNLLKHSQLKNYFTVSTDKAANPVNMMGASKRIMEMFLFRHAVEQSVSTARFANVAFSDGSLLHGFTQRFAKRQPIAAPNDVKRFFISPAESGELCLLSGLLGNNREIFFPKLDSGIDELLFSDLAISFLESSGFEPFECSSEQEARERFDELFNLKKWPCYFFKSNTTGEKEYEEFFTDLESLDLDRFSGIGVINNAFDVDDIKLDKFIKGLSYLRTTGLWSRADLIDLFRDVLVDFNHFETGFFLDQKM